MRSSDLTPFLTLDVFHQDTAFQNHCLPVILFTKLCLPNIQLMTYFDILTQGLTMLQYHMSNQDILEIALWARLIYPI